MEKIESRLQELRQDKPRLHSYLVQHYDKLFPFLVKRKERTHNDFINYKHICKEIDLSKNASSGILSALREIEVLDKWGDGKRNTDHYNLYEMDTTILQNLETVLDSKGGEKQVDK